MTLKVKISRSLLCLTITLFAAETRASTYAERQRQQAQEYIAKAREAARSKGPTAEALKRHEAILTKIDQEINAVGQTLEEFAAEPLKSHETSASRESSKSQLIERMALLQRQKRLETEEFKALYGRG